MRAGLVLEQVDKSFAGAKAVERLSLEVHPGEVVALTGPSGAGKTTTCRLVAGLEYADAGNISVAGRDVTRLPPQQRDVSLMFESFALYPMMNVADNIAFALRAPTRAGRTDAAAIARCIDEVLALTEMSDLRERMPHELSGGQKQRVALCRALALEPAVYLMDEPISHLDAKLRHKLRAALRRRLVAAPAPTLWCTPDSMEALSVADRVAVLVDGRLQQFDRPEAIYTRPANTQVARLVGDPGMNLLPGTLVRDDGALRFRHKEMTVDLSDETRTRLDASGSSGNVVLGVRATDMEIAEPGAADAHRVEVYSYEPFGKYAILTAKLGGDMIKAKIFDATHVDIGDVLSIRLHGRNAVVFDAATAKAI